MLRIIITLFLFFFLSSISFGEQNTDKKIKTPKLPDFLILRNCIRDKKSAFLRFFNVDFPLSEAFFVKSFFEKAITTGLNSHTYYVPMSTLQIAIEYERIGENKKAKSYYNKCLNIKGFNYERGIHQKAKAGLERISN